MAIGGTPQAPILVAVDGSNVLQGAIGVPSSSSTNGSIASLNSVSPGLTSANILSMSTSVTQGNTYVWVFTNEAGQTLTRFNMANINDISTFKIATDTNTRQLVSVLDASAVAIIGPGNDSILVSYYTSAGAGLNNTIQANPASLQTSWFAIPSQSSFFQLQSNATSLVVTPFALPSTSPSPTQTKSGAVPLEVPTNQPESSPKNNIAIIVGSIVGVLVIAAIVIAFVIVRKRKSRGARSIFARKRNDLFPAKADETMVPLGLYHTNRSLPEVPRHLENDLERLGYSQGPNNGAAHANMMAASAAPFLVHQSRNSSNNNMDENIPIEAALKHNRHDISTPQGLTHSLSMSSSTSKFARRNTKNGKRFEEKIQLQVIRYEIQDAHLVSPHGSIGRLVLGTYHIISPPRSARSVKAQGGRSQALARSGTVVVRKSRTNLGSGQSSSRDTVEDSSMLITDAENQHTFEASTLKWYMTEIHWKREAALLKHLKSPIFVMELLESYCIPALQNRANTYPFVNALGACSSLLSDVGPVKTAQHARSILRTISAAVDWCHRHGVVHLNIQPGSFFLDDGIDPKTEDAPWKLWDFTCARFIGEPIGTVGGGGDSNLSQQEASALPTPPQSHLQPEAYPFLEQRQMEEQLDRICGNPLPAAYTAPELLEAWRAGDTSFPAEVVMDTWSLGCVYYEILSGQPLFRTEADAWGLIGGWDNKDKWASEYFKVPYPPPATGNLATSNILSGVVPSVQDNSTPYEKSKILDPTGTIAQLLRDMMLVHADERITLETIMERIY
ncbi:hypothetical protein BGZ49_008815 [Haplosporangium sp. Z 27]|nr:hypothetical protein BGZ49_008815 [Haplosporangium sp. Z 27]